MCEENVHFDVEVILTSATVVLRSAASCTAYGRYDGLSAGSAVGPGVAGTCGRNRTGDGDGGGGEREVSASVHGCSPYPTLDSALGES